MNEWWESPEGAVPPRPGSSWLVLSPSNFYSQPCSRNHSSSVVWAPEGYIFFHFYHFLLTPIPAHALSRGSCSRWNKNNSSHDHTTHTPAKPHCEPSLDFHLRGSCPRQIIRCARPSPQISAKHLTHLESLLKHELLAPTPRILGFGLGGTGSQVTLLGCCCSRVPLENLCSNLAPGAQCWSPSCIHQILSTRFKKTFLL